MKQWSKTHNIIVFTKQPPDVFHKTSLNSPQSTYVAASFKKVARLQAYKRDSKTGVLYQFREGFKNAFFADTLFLYISFKLWHIQLVSIQILHKKWSFPLRISSVNVTKSGIPCGFGHIYWRNLYENFTFCVMKSASIVKSSLASIK